MKKQNIIILIVTLIIFVVIISAITYAALAPEKIVNNLNINANIADRITYNFTVSGDANLSTNVAFANMAANKVGNYFASNNGNIVVTIESSADEPVCCSYDIMWEWEETNEEKNKYTLSTGATNEYVLEGSLTETYYNGSSNVNIPKTNPIFTNQLPNYDDNDLSKTVYSTKICTKNTTLETQTWTLNTKFYNLNVNQDRFKGATIKGKAKIGNQSCGKLPATDTITALASETGAGATDGHPGGMVSDEYGIRYIGENPSNFVWFNCSDLDNQNASTCERWRIIGVFDEKYDSDGDNIPDTTGPLIKIIRNDSLGDYSWDWKRSGVGSSTDDYGSNDWSDSQLMMMLNPPEFLNSGYVTEEGAATHSNTISGEYVVSNGINIFKNMGSYFDSTKTAYEPYATYSYGYGYDSSGTALTERTSNVLANTTTFKRMNQASQSMIATVKWHLTGPNGIKYQSSSNGLASHFYAYERNNPDGTGYVYTGAGTRPKIWYGKVGLMYLSDYGFATNGTLSTSENGVVLTRNECLSHEIFKWRINDTSTSYYNCSATDWLLYRNATGGTSATKGSTYYQWTITSFSSAAYNVFIVRSSGYVFSNTADGSAAGRPVVFLNPNVGISSGSGTYNEPYKLSQ